MIVCKACGKENQDHYKFCLGCGAELTRAAAKSEQQDMAMMKTMMADVGHSGPSPTPPRGTPLPGVAYPTPSRPSAPAAAPSAPAPAAPPPAGPPPGVPTSSAPASRPLFGGAAAGANAGAGGGYTSDFASSPGTRPGASGFDISPTTTPGTSGFQPAAQPPERPCPSCGTAVPAAFKFCGACGHKMEEASAPRTTAERPVPQQEPHGTLTLIRPDGSEGGTHTLEDGENTIGREHGAIFENDGYLSPTHAELVVNAAGAVIRDLDSLNGVFVRMVDEEEILGGQIIRIGQELLRFDFIEPPEPLEDGTEVMGSPNPGYWGKISVIIGDGIDGSAFPLLGDSVTLGRERGDINFPDDGYVSGLHARLSTRDGRVFLTDLGSSNGTFMKVQGERELADGAFVLLGQQLFRLNLR